MLDTEQIHLNHFSPHRNIGLPREGAVTVSARIIDEDINPTPGLVDKPEHLGDGLGIGNVRLEGDRFAMPILDPMHEQLCGFRMGDIVDRHFCTRVGEAKCNRLTDAGIAARYEGAFMVESNVHDGPPCLTQESAGVRFRQVLMRLPKTCLST